MLYILHRLLIAMYLLAPILAAGYVAYRMKRGAAQPLANLLMTLIVGATLGSAATMTYAFLLEGRASYGQFILTIYLTSAMLLILKGFDRLLDRLMRPLIRRAVPVALIRLTALIAFGLPFMLSAAMTYRPRIVNDNDPMSMLDREFQPVQFASTDGVMISAWWLPPQGSRQQRESTGFGTKTIILCPGLSENKAAQLMLSWRIIPAGYNALVLDFRGFGGSGGRMTSFGDLERRDVLGAVRWLRANHPEQSQRIVAAGAGTGAAALIAAAVDPGQEGQSIEALAVYAPFDDLNLLTRDFVDGSFAAPLGWMVRRVGLPLASIHAGANLGAFKPSQLVHDLWPRPILVIHGTFDEVIPFDRGRGLFDAASLPKDRIWLMRENHVESLRNPEAARAVRDFFELAIPVPII